MDTLLLTNIGVMYQARRTAPQWAAGKEMAVVPELRDAWLFIENGKIVDFGEMNVNVPQAQNTYDCEGAALFPTWCDSHTHIVYAGSREAEFVDKIKGLSYEEIALRGGGILNSAAKLAQTSEDELYRQAMWRIEEIKTYGTGAVEIKSGYGLDTENELKMLRVIRRIKQNTELTVKATFLGAHALPARYRNNRDAYIREIVDEMLPAVARENLADFADVFCDKGFFTPDETAIILDVARKYGLRAKIHANELDYSGGIQTGVHYDALSVDHLEYTGEDEISVLLESGTMPTLLPSTAFFLRLKQPPARQMMDAGLPLALASDYNPGSSPSGNMPFVLSLACINLRMLPEEALNAATLNAAYAMGVSNELGSITPGKKANLFLSKNMPSLAFLPYAFGSQKVDRVMLNGEWMR
ncbi:MAG: imidazolonepropionase [Bacteroidia bacterium]|jgi:imidazolonepropionase